MIDIMLREDIHFWKGEKEKMMKRSCCTDVRAVSECGCGPEQCRCQFPDNVCGLNTCYCEDMEF